MPRWLPFSEVTFGVTQVGVEWASRWGWSRQGAGGVGIGVWVGRASGCGRSEQGAGGVGIRVAVGVERASETCAVRFGEWLLEYEDPNIGKRTKVCFSVLIELCGQVVKILQLSPNQKVRGFIVGETQTGARAVIAH